MFAGLCLLVLLTPSPCGAQEAVTITFRTGEVAGAELIDLGGIGFTIRQSGVERRIAVDTVAAVDFMGGPIPEAQWSRVAGGTHLLVLRSGLTVEGLWDDVGGTRPLRITFVGPTGSRDYASTEVARILLAPRTTAPATPPPTTPPPTTPPPTTPPPAGGPCDLATLVGSWNAGGTFGELVFQSAGGCAVRGTYSVSGGGSIGGTLANSMQDGVMARVVRFRWTRSDNTETGNAYAVIASDNVRIGGRWCSGANCDPNNGQTWWASKMAR